MADKRITDVDFIDSLNSDESFFVNQSNSLKQINKSNVVFGVNNGGTGAITAEEARTNLGITPTNIGAANLNHEHSITEIDELQDRLDGKVDVDILNDYATQDWVIEQIRMIAIYNGE